jgi:hypothetical protein
VIKRWYVEIDRMIGRWLADLGDEWAVIVLSDHGGGPAPTRYLHVNHFLAQRGYLKPTSSSRARVASLVSRQVNALRRRVPGKVWLKNHLPAALKSQVRQLRNGTGRVEWAATFACRSSSITGINLNAAGSRRASSNQRRVQAATRSCGPPPSWSICHRCAALPPYPQEGRRAAGAHRQRARHPPGHGRGHRRRTTSTSYRGGARRRSAT